jgi:hypothetical protein
MKTTMLSVLASLALVFAPASPALATKMNCEDCIELMDGNGHHIGWACVIQGTHFMSDTCTATTSSCGGTLCGAMAGQTLIQNEQGVLLFAAHQCGEGGPIVVPLARVAEIRT